MACIFQELQAAGQWQHGQFHQEPFKYKIKKIDITSETLKHLHSTLLNQCAFYGLFELQSKVSLCCSMARGLGKCKEL